MGKTWVIIATLIATAMLLMGCNSTSEKWPRVVLEPTTLTMDVIKIPLRDGYSFAEQYFEIEETDVGYDIIIHAIEMQVEVEPWNGSKA